MKQVFFYFVLLSVAWAPLSWSRGVEGPLPKSQMRHGESLMSFSSAPSIGVSRAEITRGCRELSGVSPVACNDLVAALGLAAGQGPDQRLEVGFDQLLEGCREQLPGQTAESCRAWLGGLGLQAGIPVGCRHLSREGASQAVINKCVREQLAGIPVGCRDLVRRGASQKLINDCVQQYAALPVGCRHLLRKGASQGQINDCVRQQRLVEGVHPVQRLQPRTDSI